MIVMMRGKYLLSKKGANCLQILSIVEQWKTYQKVSSLTIKTKHSQFHELDLLVLTTYINFANKRLVLG